MLLGVTGSGKTFTIAKVIENVNRPTLVLSHNKTLGAQLYQEFENFFPDNAVEYFVSYYDYYQPEAYIPQTRSLHREGDDEERGDRQAASRGDEVALRAARRHHRRLGLLHLRHRRSRALLRHAALLREGGDASRSSSTCAARRDAVRAHAVRSRRAASSACAATCSRSGLPTRTTRVRIEFFGDEIDAISRDRPAHAATHAAKLERLAVYPEDALRHAAGAAAAGDRTIREELDERVAELRARTGCSRPSGSRSARCSTSR